MPKCPHCGSDLQPGVRFCAGCGSAVHSSDTGSLPAQLPQESHPAEQTQQTQSSQPQQWSPQPRPQWAPPPAQWAPAPEAQWSPPPEQHWAPQPEQHWAPGPEQQWAPQPEPRWAPPTDAQWPAQPGHEPPVLPLVPPAYEPPAYESPPPARQPRTMSRGPVLIIASAALLVVAAVAVVIVFRHVSHSPSAAASPSTTTVAQAPPPGQPTDTVTAPDTAAPETTEPPVTTMDEASARTALDQQVSTDHTAVEQLVGSWVPQLSAKKVGLVADGITYDYESILSDYQNEVAQYPGALLLKSGDYSSFKFPGFYVTVAPQSFGSAAAANQWCDSQNIDADDCFAKRLMHTGGYQGNTVGRK